MRKEILKIRPGNRSFLGKENGSAVVEKGRSEMGRGEKRKGVYEEKRERFYGGGGIKETCKFDVCLSSWAYHFFVFMYKS